MEEDIKSWKDQPMTPNIHRKSEMLNNQPSLNKEKSAHITSS